MKKQLTYGIVGILALSFIASANGQEIKDNIAEDQVIICVNGHVVELSGNICKVFNMDDQDLQQAQSDLYKYPNSDTFNMDVSD
jgi:hypothetical protein